MNIREFYIKAYPTDELGLELSTTATLVGMFAGLIEGKDIYEYIGVSDSLIRERLFEKIAEEWNVSYDLVYKLWLK
jgi:hypothetical protein